MRFILKEFWAKTKLQQEICNVNFMWEIWKYSMIVYFLKENRLMI